MKGPVLFGYTENITMLCRLILAIAVLIPSLALSAEPVNIRDRRELFVDDFMIDTLTGGAARRLHHPAHREIVMEFGEKGPPWEGNIAYLTVIRDGDRILMYYSARFMADFGGRKDPAVRQVACVAESADGIHFKRPKLGIHDISWAFGEDVDTSENNVIWRGMPTAHNFTPFLDTNPAKPREERFKAIGRRPSSVKKGGALAVFVSPDGYRWKPFHKESFASSPTDSQNGGFWDPVLKKYVVYLRGKTNVRTIRRCVSEDLVNWTEPKLVEYTDDRKEHMYTNGILPYERAPHIYIGLPARFVPGRKKIPAHPHRGVSDGVLMGSRDGKTFDRWEEAFVRPGPDPEVWTDRNNYPALGVIRTSPTEFSVYWTEHYRHEVPRIRRGTIRVDGFVSVHAGSEEGELLTRPFIFSGDRLTVNYATSAIGSLRFEMCDAEGKAIKGFALKDSEELFGNEIEHTVAWKRDADVGALAGRPVRLRARLHDADLYSMRFAPEPEKD